MNKLYLRLPEPKNYWIAFVILFLLLIGRFSYAQNGGVSTSGTWGPDYEVVGKCVDSLDLGTNFISFYEVQTLRAGVATVFARFRANGNSFTPPSGKQTIGQCPTSVTVTPDSIRSIEVLALCDYNSGTLAAVPFWRIIQRTYWPSTGAGSFQILANLGTNGSSYTPVASATYDQPCFGSANPNESNSAVINTSTAFNAVGNRWASWSVENVGLSVITLTTIGGTVDLYPGETRYCAEQINFLNKTMRSCGNITVNATGGRAHVYAKER